jgi:hypothetical protein
MRNNLEECITRDDSEIDEDYNSSLAEYVESYTNNNIYK